jgi:hypothetical protein
MKVVSLRWLGVPTGEYAQMARFLRDVTGLRVNFEEATTIEVSLPSGDEIQLFAPLRRQRCRSPGCPLRD